MRLGKSRDRLGARGGGHPPRSGENSTLKKGKYVGTMSCCGAVLGVPYRVARGEWIISRESLLSPQDRALTLLLRLDSIHQWLDARPICDKVAAVQGTYILFYGYYSTHLCAAYTSFSTHLLRSADRTCTGYLFSIITFLLLALLQFYLLLLTRWQNPIFSLLTSTYPSTTDQLAVYLQRRTLFCNRWQLLELSDTLVVHARLRN